MTPEPNNLAFGLKIMFIIGAPCFLVYWIRSTLTPPKVIPRTHTLIVYAIPQRLKPKSLRYCENHLTLVPKGRIALIVEPDRCDLCKKGVPA